MRTLLLISLAACTKADSVDTTDTVVATPQAPEGRLLIEEVYYSGSPPAGGADHYFSDQFIELMNISQEPVDASGLLVGDAYGLAGVINQGDEPDGQGALDPDHVYMSNIWRVPADTVVAPGDSLLLAHDGTNHQPFSTVDLTGADFEAWVDGGNDDDYPTVDNLEEVLFTGGYDWLMTVFGPSVVVLSADAEPALERGQVGRQRTLKAPVAFVVDGVDILMSRDSVDFKRLPVSVDAGFTNVAGTYVGRSVKRVRVGGVPQDTNDSSVDFEPGDPEPG